MDIARAIATAKRLIEKNGQAVVWRKPAPADPTAKPWRDVRDGDPTNTPVKIVWITPKLRTLAFLANAKGTDIPAGVEEALMCAQAFEPELTDRVVVNGVEQSLYRVDPIKPNGTPILYRLYINRKGAA
jgi:hypothetical protein